LLDLWQSMVASASVLSPMAPFSKRYNPEGRFVSFLGLVL
jgi:hypothetical protein